MKDRLCLGPRIRYESIALANPVTAEVLHIHGRATSLITITFIVYPLHYVPIMAVARDFGQDRVIGRRHCPSLVHT